MARRAISWSLPPDEHHEPTEVVVTFLAGYGSAWPLALCLAPWVAVEGAHDGEMAGLMRAIRISAVMLAGWIEDGEASARGLQGAAPASFELIDALGDGDDLHVE